METELLEKLRAAYAALRELRFQEAAILLDEVRGALTVLPERHPLWGEWELVSALAEVYDLAAALPRLERAAARIEGRSSVLGKGQPMTLDYEAFALYFRPGQADAAGETLERACRLYQALTGSGAETALVYKAQLAADRGAIDEAFSLAQRACHTARASENTPALLSAANILGRLARHQGDAALWLETVGLLEDIAAAPAVETACRQQAEIMIANGELSFGHLRNVPLWLREGNFPVVPAPETVMGCVVAGERPVLAALPAACLLHAEYLLYNGEAAKALNSLLLADKGWGALWVPYARLYAALYQAACYNALGHSVQAERAVEEALTMAAPDGLWMILAEFASSALGPIILRKAEDYGSEAAERVLQMEKGYMENLRRVRTALHKSGQVRDLTDREYEIAVLAADGSLSYADIGKKLFISERTVKFHLNNIFSALNIEKRRSLRDALQGTERHATAFWARQTKKE